jgi:hypothetical protein
METRWEWNSTRSIILSDNPLFNETLASPPPINCQKILVETGKQINFVMDSQTGLLKEANLKELEEYLWGGEYHYLNSDSEEEEFY